ncbi:hypothetical protein [Pseudomonas sp. 1152_12]|uniref:hypothetical protein n=1 Tax=Pseudomonas sp. 1152_12 TaxID=2604455 RepID=UPI0040646491
MERTNREIINSFTPKDPYFYKTTRFEPALFEDQVPGYPGLLTRSGAKAQTTNLLIPLWSSASTDPDHPDIVTIQIARYIDLSGMDEQQEITYFETKGVSFQHEVSNPPDPVPVPIPQAYRSPGVYLITYHVDVIDSNNSNTSVAHLLIIDETSPYDRPRVNPPEPMLPVGLTGPLNLAYVQAQPNRTAMFPIRYSALEGCQEGDYLLMYFGSSDKPYAYAPPSPDTKFLIDPARPLAFPLPESVIAAEHKNNYDLRYRVFDACGNPSELSYSLSLDDLAQAPLPSDFSSPTVDSAVPLDGLLDRNDVAVENGARVRVPRFQNGLPTDEVIVALTSPFGTVRVTVPVGTANAPSLLAQFSPAEMATLYGPLAAGKNRVRVVASYVVSRGTATYPAPPTVLETPFDLDLSVVGPVGPLIVGPGNLNPNLPLVVVQAIRPGNLFGPDNHLEAADVNRPARARIPLWTTAALPADTLPFVVTLNYGGHQLTKPVTAIPASGFVDFEIAFSDIKAVGGPAQHAFYSISSTGSANPSVSSSTLVTVDSVILRMDAPVVLNNNGIINCSTLVPPDNGRLKIRIPGSEYLQAGQVIDVRFQGFQNNTQTAPVVVDVSRPFTVPDAAAAQSGWVVDFDVSAPVLFIPINANRSLLTQGSATVTTSTQYQGQTVPSLVGNYRVRGFRPGTAPAQFYCGGGLVPN